MFSSLKLFCLLSSVWHVSAMTVATTVRNDEQIFETVIADVTTDVSLNLENFCWSEQSDSCSIIGNFTHNTNGLSFPVNIDCSTNMSEGSEPLRTHSAQYIYKHFRHVEVIALNGCGANVAYRLQMGNYKNLLGIEYIPDPMNVRHLTLEMFKVHGNLNRGAFFQFKNTKSLLLTNNKIDRITEGSFTGLTGIEEMIFQENSIQSIDRTAFNPCSDSLEKLVIQERQLNLGELEPLKKLTELWISTKELDWVALTVGLNSLSTTTISHVQNVLYNKTSTPRTFSNLTKMGVTFCNITEFPIDRYPRLQHFNISHNSLSNVSVKELQMLGLHTLDISHNKFKCIDISLLSSLWDLEYFYATHNQIIAVNPKAFQKNYIIKVIDLRFNHIKRLPIDAAMFLNAMHAQIIIDHNNFDCAWINDYYGMDPKLFTTKFIYAKDYSDVNIKGLRCTYFSGDFRYHSHLFDDDEFHNGLKPRRPPHPVEILRRNPRHTAFLTICILVVGVSCLLISLYFYVKYRTLTSTLNSNSLYGWAKEDQNKDKSINNENRPDIIQDRKMSVRQLETSSRLMLPKSSSSPRSIGLIEDHANIEFKDSFGMISEQRKASLPNRFESVPIRTQKVIFDIEPDTFEN